MAYLETVPSCNTSPPEVDKLMQSLSNFSPLVLWARLSVCGSRLGVHRAHFSLYMALLIVHRARLSLCRSRLGVHRAHFSLYMALLIVHWARLIVFFGVISVRESLG